MEDFGTVFVIFIAKGLNLVWYLVNFILPTALHPFFPLYDFLEKGEKTSCKNFCLQYPDSFVGLSWYIYECFLIYISVNIPILSFFFSPFHLTLTVFNFLSCCPQSAFWWWKGDVPLRNAPNATQYITIIMNRLLEWWTCRRVRILESLKLR